MLQLTASKRRGGYVMKVKSLSYIVVDSTDINQWDSYARDVVGLMKNDGKSDANNLFLRMDESPFRFQVRQGDVDRYAVGGFELGSKEEFEDAKKELTEAGIQFIKEEDTLAEIRCVEELISLVDPAGNSLELFHGRSTDQKEFKSTQDISSFVTHGLGLGHVVFGTLEIEATHDFYADILGFGDSDIMHMRFSPNPDDPESVLYFMHCDNPRHHTVAMMQAPTPPSGLVHGMVEVENAGQVVAALDRAVANNVHISSTLGRHMNDKMFSFYMQTPAGFMLEFGYDGIQPDWETFETTNSAAPSYWGHEFNMPEA
jgi:3,4-dihydroxy-9,10-secoandrosta-1,3,5(10)-triene-9,17-dione 4,5-dioxygenase